MLDILGHIPEEGEECRIDGLTFTAEEVKGRRIEKVLITRDPDPQPALVEEPTS
jgi:CBS domain containing-hemolysin-like protein